MSVFESAKMVTALEVARRENIRFRGNRAFCPFHDDGSNPSLSFKGRYFNCFGCNEKGDSVDFVAKLYHMSKYKAAVWLNDTFALGLTDEKPSGDEVDRRRREKKSKAARDEAIRLARDDLCWAEKTIERFRPTCWEEINPDMMTLIGLLDRISYVLDEKEFPEDIGWKVAEKVAKIRSRVCGRHAQV